MLFINLRDYYHQLTHFLPAIVCTSLVVVSKTIMALNSDVQNPCRCLEMDQRNVMQVCKTTLKRNVISVITNLRTLLTPTLPWAFAEGVVTQYLVTSFSKTLYLDLEKICRERIYVEQA